MPARHLSRAARGPAGPAPGPSRALASSQPVTTLYTAHMSCHGGGLESSPLGCLHVLHRSSVRGLVGREGAGEGHWAGKCASRQAVRRVATRRGSRAGREASRTSKSKCDVAASP
eukprot:scaffold102176_cov42-Phaeocystis_antarctica.AAC.2